MRLSFWEKRNYKILRLLSGEVYFTWKGIFGRHRNSFNWKAAPLCLMWTIWREENNHTFDGFELSIKLRGLLGVPVGAICHQINGPNPLVCVCLLDVSM